jgi:hypothetical protein
MGQDPESGYMRHVSVWLRAKLTRREAYSMSLAKASLPKDQTKL